MMKYKVHHFEINMNRDQVRFEQFLNGLKGEVVAIIPNVTLSFLWVHRINFLLVVEKAG